MDNPQTIFSSYETFTHVRIIIGMILGISISRLVVGMSRFLQHPVYEKAYPTHLCWVFFILFYIIHFWWFELSLTRIESWNFSTYFFLVIYTSNFVILAAMLFPDDMGKYRGFKDYLQARRKAFYSVLFVLFSLDVIDTLIKGEEYYTFYGWGYTLRSFILILGSFIAIFIRSEKYQLIFVVIALAYQMIWLLHLFGLDFSF